MPGLTVKHVKTPKTRNAEKRVSMQYSFRSFHMQRRAIFPAALYGLWCSNASWFVCWFRCYI